MRKSRIVGGLLLLPLGLFAARGCLSPFMSDMHAWDKEAARFKHVDLRPGPTETHYRCGKCGKPAWPNAQVCSYCGVEFIGKM